MHIAGIVVLLVAIAACNAGGLYGKDFKDADDECKEELGESAKKSCLIACQLQKVGIMKNGTFDVEATNARMDTFRHKVMAGRYKQASEMCIEEMGMISSDEYNNAAAVFYCINFNTFAPGGPHGPDGPRGRGGPGGPEDPDGPDGPGGRCCPCGPDRPPEMDEEDTTSS